MPLTLKEFWQESQNLGNRTISLSSLMARVMKTGCPAPLAADPRAALGEPLGGVESLDRDGVRGGL